MSWLDVASGLTLLAVATVVAWKLLDAWADDDTIPRCRCGKRYVRFGPVTDYSDLVVHDVALCSPFREWVDD